MTDPEAMITIISKRGYATGTTYISSVMRIINQYNLTKYDKQAISTLTTGASLDLNKNTQETTLTPTPSSETSKTIFYRVQVGVFSTISARDKLIKNIKNKLNFDCFYERVNNNYYVYCGSFKDKKKSEERVLQLKSKKFNAFIKAVS